MSSLKRLISEAHRRSLWQVLAIYLAGSFGALQVVDLVAKNVGLPEWTTPFAVILLVIGFPIVMATAFVQERGPVSIPGIMPEARKAAPPVPTGATSAAPAMRRHRRLLTWRNAILGGVAAFAVFGFTTAGYMTMRGMGIGPAGTLLAQGALPDRAEIVVAELESTTGDTLLARAATEALRIDLAQSPVVKVLEVRQVALALGRMQRPAGAPLDVTVATEVAEREGAAAVVAGEINGVGRGFVLTVRLLDTKNGEELIPLRENARDSADVIDAIDRLSKKLRERIGESYRSLRSGQPLARVTTSSLEALRKYSQGARAIDVEGQTDRGIDLLTEAVALDTAFAMAYRKLGTTLGFQFRERARAVDAMTRAYQHRDRLSARERYLAEFSYFSGARHDPAQAIRAGQNMLELDSMDFYALNNLGVMYSRVNDNARAESYYLAAIRADSSNALSWTNAVSARINQGRFADARELLEQFRSRFPNNPRYLEFSGLLEAAQLNHEAAERIVRARRDSAGDNTGTLVQSTLTLSRLAVLRGRVGEANRHLAIAEGIDEKRGLASQVLQSEIEGATTDAYVRRQPAAALSRLEEALRRQPLSQLHPLERPYSELAITYAASGRPERARQLLAEYDTAVEPDLRPLIGRLLHSLSQSVVAVAEGRSPDGIQVAIAAGASVTCYRCTLPFLAQAYDAAGQPDSAIAAYERYLATPFTFAIDAVDHWFLGATYERLGQLYDAKGDLRKASEHYNRFIELWKDADPELQPRVQAARSRLAQLVSRQG